MPIKEVAGPCVDCGSDEVCGEFPYAGPVRPLCYDCWHKAHEALPPYAVRRIDTPEHVAKYGYWYWGGIHGALTMTRERAEAKRLEIIAEQEKRNAWWREEMPSWDEDARKHYSAWPEGYPHDGTKWEVVPMERWSGERIAHPGYLNRRRALVARMEVG